MIKKILKYIFIYRLIPPIFFLKLKFKKYHGYKLNLNNPLTINEKIQWLKLYDRKNINQICADKYKVREFISKVVGQHILVELFARFEKLEDIVPSAIPKQPFVIKSNNGCGQVLLIRDLESFNLQLTKNIISRWIKPWNNIYYFGKEWQYKYMKPVIIFEQLLQIDGKIPNDFKFHCFNGRVEIIYLSLDREGINKRNIYDKNWSPLNFSWTNDPQKKVKGPEISRPGNLNEMIEISERIAQYFKYVRVDLYSVEGKIFFGEITLHHGSGFDKIEPFDWDLYLGQKLNLELEPSLTWN